MFIYKYLSLQSLIWEFTFDITNFIACIHQNVSINFIDKE